MHPHIITDDTKQIFDTTGQFSAETMSILYELKPTESDSFCLYLWLHQQTVFTDSNSEGLLHPSSNFHYRTISIYNAEPEGLEITTI